MVNHPLRKDAAMKMKMIIDQKEKESGAKGETCKNKERKVVNEEEENSVINKKERNVINNVNYSRNNEKIINYIKKELQFSKISME